MGIGQDHAIAADDETRTLGMGRHIATLKRPLTRNAAKATEEFQEGIVAKGVAGLHVLHLLGVGIRIFGLGAAGDADVDHGRAIAFGDLRKVRCHDAGLRQGGLDRCAGRHGGMGMLTFNEGDARTTDDTGGDQRQHQARGGQGNGRVIVHDSSFRTVAKRDNATVRALP